MGRKRLAGEKKLKMEVERFQNPDWHKGTPGFLRNLMKTALKDLALLLMLLALGELGVRFFYPQASRHLFGPTVTGGHPILLNSHELRDLEFPTQKPANERRILCLGDSATFGAGVAAQETYSKQLETLLHRSKRNARWRVINAGGQGSSVSGQTTYLKEKGLSFGPSLVILGFSPSMLSVAGHGAAANPADRSPKNHPNFLSPWERAGRSLHRQALSLHVLLHSSYLYVLLDANVRKRLYRLGVIQDRLDHPTGAILAYAFDVPGNRLEEAEAAYQILHRELAELKGVLDLKRIPLLVLGIPSRFRISQNSEDNERGYPLSKIRIEPLERVAQSCSTLGLLFVDLTPRLQQEREAMRRGEKPWDDLYIPADYAHLNKRGMEIAAEELLTFLQQGVLGRRLWGTGRLSSPKAGE